MDKICTSADIERLRVDGRLDPAYLDYATSLFEQLPEAFGDYDQSAEFSLEEHGPIVLLEHADDVRRLEGVGLDDRQGGL